jgi:hypothetical protein
MQINFRPNNFFSRDGQSNTEGDLIRDEHGSFEFKNFWDLK